MQELVSIMNLRAVTELNSWSQTIHTSMLIALLLHSCLAENSIFWLLCFNYTGWFILCALYMDLVHMLLSLKQMQNMFNPRLSIVSHFQVNKGQFSDVFDVCGRGTNVLITKNLVKTIVLIITHSSILYRLPDYYQLDQPFSNLDFLNDYFWSIFETLSK